MKWFKHMTDSLEDPFISELLDNFGHQGYTAYFGLIETICKENNNKLTGRLEVQPMFLKRKLRISRDKLQKIYSFCAGEGKLLFTQSEGISKQNSGVSKVIWEFYLPKIAELKDNYSGGPGFKGLTKTVRDRIKERDGGVCRYCEKAHESKDLIIDHVIPFDKGGGTEDSNLVTTCRTCHSQKRGRTAEQAGMVVIKETTKKVANHKEVEVEEEVEVEKAIDDSVRQDAVTESPPEIDPELQDFLLECQTMGPVADSGSTRFWEGLIRDCEDYKLSDQWIAKTVRAIDQWQLDNPQRRSRSAKGLRQRIRTWFNKELNQMERVK